MNHRGAALLHHNTFARGIMPRLAKSRTKTRPRVQTRILVIDDDDAVREATPMLLEAQRFDVVSVPDGKSGIEAVKAGSFDLVIVDLFMPGIDGLQTTKAIRQLSPCMPVIAVSGFMLGKLHLDMPNFDAMATEVGAFSTLYKPFQPAALFEAIGVALAGAAPLAPLAPARQRH
jgi:CheY-like chemotaxis protein